MPIATMELIERFQLFCGGWPREAVVAFAQFIDDTATYKAGLVVEQLKLRIMELETEVESMKVKQ